MEKAVGKKQFIELPAGLVEKPPGKVKLAPDADKRPAIKSTAEIDFEGGIVMSTKVVTGKVRFSYANVWEPQSVKNGSEPKYSVSLIIPKSDKTLQKKIKAAIEAAKQEGLSKLGGRILSFSI